jgi:hypothetical protein
VRTRGIEPANTRSKRPIPELKRHIEGFPPLFLISLRARGTGLNLTAADTVIHYDPWWNPTVEDQATPRPVRWRALPHQDRSRPPRPGLLVRKSHARRRRCAGASVVI